MIKDLKNTFRQSLIYGLGNVLVKATGLALMPIYIGAFDTEAYGALVIFEVMTQFMVGVFSFRIQSGLLRLASEREPGEGQGSIYFTSVLLMLALAVGVYLAFLPTSSFFSRFLFDSADYANLFPILFASIALEMLALMPMQLFRVQERPLAFISYLAFKLACMLGFVSYFILAKDMGLYGALLGILLANAAMLLATLPAQVKHAVARFDKEAAIEMFRFGAPLIFTSISAILLSIGDRFIIKIFGELSDVGVYGAAYKVGSVVNLLVINSFTLGFLPIAFKRYGKPGFDNFFTKMLSYFTLVTVLLTLLISLFSKELIKMISSDSPDYWLAAVLVPFIAFSFIFKAIQYYLSLSFHLTKRTRYDALVTMAGFAINIGLNFTLIPIFGLYGAIAATGLSYIAMGFITRYYAARMHPISYEWKRIGLLILSCSIAIAIGILINEMDIIVRLVIKALITSLYLAFLYFVFADKAEKEKIRKLRMALREKGGLNKLLSEAFRT